MRRVERSAWSIVAVGLLCGVFLALSFCCCNRKDSEKAGTGSECTSLNKTPDSSGLGAEGAKQAEAEKSVAPEGWTIQTVDDPGDVGAYNSIAVTPAGKVHISYHDNSGCKWRDLKYATNVSGSWQLHRLDWYWYVGRNTSIALDPDGNVHIGYIDNDYNDLLYTTNATEKGAWQQFTVDSYSPCADASIAVDSNGKVHISYKGMEWMYPYDISLRYATSAAESEGWRNYSLDAGVDIRNTSIAVGSGNTVHIAYDWMEWSSSEVRYASNASGYWQVSTVDSSGMYNPSIAVFGNTAHISYGMGGVKYAVGTHGSWNVYTVDGGACSSIAVDSFGNAHIAYRGDDGELKYATNKSGEWHKRVIDPDVNYEWECGTSIAVDASGYAHIAYYHCGDYTSHPSNCCLRNCSQGDLKYATNRPPVSR